jgi:hypothetical protein
MWLYVNSAATSFNDITKYLARIALQRINDPQRDPPLG